MENIKKDYEILEQISSTSFSDIFYIKEKQTSEFYLLKLLKSKEDAYKQSKEDIIKKVRFKREVDFFSSIEHPNISKPLRVISTKEDFYLLYPYYFGNTLNRIFERNVVFSATTALSYISQLLDAIEYIHARGIIHCNINPHNIFLTEEKGLYLLDFSLAIHEDEAKKIPEGVIYGTIPYLAPEQTGFTDIKIDFRTDLYCIGILLYKMISGTHPLAENSNSIDEILNSSLKKEILPIKNIPNYLNSIILKALKPSKEDRYQTASGFKYDIMNAIECIKEEKKIAISIGQKDSIMSAFKSNVFVGRDYELEQLKKGVKELINSYGSSFLIYGQSGIGKTELIRQFILTIKEEKEFLIYSKCNKFSSNHIFFVLRDIILQLLSKVELSVSGESKNIKEAISRELSDFSGILCSVMPELKNYFDNIIDIQKTEKEEERLIHAFYTFILIISKIKPFIIIIDDIQWIDKNSYEVLKRIIKTKSNCMIVFSYRTEKSEKDIFVCGENLKKTGIKKILEIKPFTYLEIKHLLLPKFGNIKNIDWLNNILYEKTDKTPFTIYQALLFIINSSVLKYQNNEWIIDVNENLPQKFDYLSIILSKVNQLDTKEKQYLQISSLMQGKIETEVVQKIGNFTREEQKSILRKLESLGLIVRKTEKSFYFYHDKIQEIISSTLTKNETLYLNEEIAQCFEEKSDTNKELIFNSAEHYLKTTNTYKAIEICAKAAEYAQEKFAFDISCKYYKNALMICTNCSTLGLPIPVDIIKLQMDFGNILMLSGRNMQALSIYLKLLEKPQFLNSNQLLEIKYKTGCIYHNMGEFTNSVFYFKTALKELNVFFPKTKWQTRKYVLKEIMLQILLNLGLKYFFKLKISNELLLKIKILNKLSYSLYFYDMLATLYVHFKSLNLSDRIYNCYEKCETYIYHTVPAYQMFLKRRAISYYNKAIDISKSLNRKDLLAFAKCFGGICLYFNAKWNTAEKYFNESIESYKKIGDYWGQLTPLEHLGYIAFYKGDFNKCKEIMKKEIELAEECNEMREKVIAQKYLLIIKFLEDGKYKIDEIERLKKNVEFINDFAVKTTINIFFAYINNLKNNLNESYLLSDKYLKDIKEKNLNQEYVTSGYTTRCETIVLELLNRKRDLKNAQINKSDKELIKELFKYAVKSYYIGLSYPAHLGAAFKFLAWYYFFKNKKSLAEVLFKKSIKKHHLLDMKYEEAKSCRDYAIFLEEINRGGEAKDAFNNSAKLFYECNAFYEIETIKEKISKDILYQYKNKGYQYEDKKNGIYETLHYKIDTLYEASSIIKEIENIDILLKQIIMSMIKISGAQYGCIFLEGDKEKNIAERIYAINYEGKEIDPKSFNVYDKVINQAKDSKSVIFIKDSIREFSDKDDTKNIGSILCAPIFLNDVYNGYIYLANNIISGLFSENTKKAVEILAVQAQIFLQNAKLLEELKFLNKNLELRVKEQTKDIEQKNQQLQEYNLKILESERMKELLGGTIVHDIKNYASGIQGNVTILAKKYPDEPRIQKTYRAVTSSCINIVSLASNLLDISKMEEGKLVIKKEIINKNILFEMANKIIKNFIFEEKNINISFVDNTNNKFEIEVDYYLIERVLQNLFSNAAKYIPSGGEMKLNLEENNEEYIICCFNSGEPIPDNFKKVIFEKYSRIEEVTNQYSKGLGLFFCKMVMNAHGGRIWLDTDDKGNYFKLAFKKQ
jgi:serine/threonine protein kinase/signal transduction histidine kinase